MPIVLAVVNDKPVMAEKQEDGGYEFTVENIQDSDSIGAAFVTIDIGVLKTDERPVFPICCRERPSSQAATSRRFVAGNRSAFGRRLRAAKGRRFELWNGVHGLRHHADERHGSLSAECAVMLKFPLLRDTAKTPRIHLLHIASDGSVENWVGIGQDDARLLSGTQVNGQTFVIVDSSQQTGGASGGTTDAEKQEMRKM